MAKSSLKIIQAIRNTAQRLEASTHYQWGHMGACNCGYLAQELTCLTKEEIHKRAMMRHGDWSEQLNDYCPSSGLPMDETISMLISFGFAVEDLKHLERLSDPAVLQQIPLADRNLHFNAKADVVKYMKVWATLVEDLLLVDVNIQDCEACAQTPAETLSRSATMAI